jgi:cell division transport system ATP-binding protein
MGEIEFRQVTRRFETGQDALREISIRFEAGSMTFLTGHSGAGKSTFLKLLLCLDRPTRGQILINGVNVTHLRARQLAFYRRQLGAVFQEHHLLAHRSVFENVALPLRVQGFRSREVARRVRAALTLVGLLEKEAQLPGRLSTGEQQRVGIARAVVGRPRILLADEPTGNLDPELSRDIMEVFRQFNELGTTVIIASHDRELVQAMGTRVVALAQGGIVGDFVPGMQPAPEAQP